MTLLDACKLVLKALEESHMADGSLIWVSPGSTAIETLRNAIEDAESSEETLKQQRDVAIRHIAEWCVQIDFVGSGWDDWDEFFKDAMWRDHELPEIRQLLNEAITAARKDRE